MLHLGFLNTVATKIDKRGKTVRILKFRYPQKDKPFVYLNWVKGPCQKVFRKGKWYQFRNYEIVKGKLRRIPFLDNTYRVLTSKEQTELGIERIAVIEYQNFLGIIEYVGQIYQNFYSNLKREINILLEDGKTKIVLNLKNKFAIKELQVGQIIHIEACKYLGQKNEINYYSTLTKNTKITVDLNLIRGRINKERYKFILILSKHQKIQEEETGEIF